MHSLLLAGLALNFNLLCGVFLPGLVLSQLLRRKEALPEPNGGWVILAAAAGSIWATLQFYVINQAAVWGLPPGGMQAAKYLSDLALIVLGWRKMPANYGSALLRQLIGLFWNRENLPGILIAVVFSIYAQIQFPFASDNAALYWLSRAVVAPHNSLFWATQGSPTYIAILYWPCLLLWPVAMPAAVGASAKLALCLLAFFSVKRLCYVFPSTARFWVPPLAFLTVLTSMLGDYGLLDTTKESVFAAFFMFAGFARLVHEDEKDSAFQVSHEAGALFSLAIGFGAITFPFIAVFLAIWFVINRRVKEIAGFIFIIGAWILIPLTFTLGMMIAKNAGVLSAAVTIGVLLVGVARAPINNLYGKILPTLSKVHPWLLETVLFVAIIGLDVLLLPFKFEANPLDPVDGKTTFWGMFCGTGDLYLPPYVQLLGFIGCLALTLRRNKPGSDGAGLAALRIYPFATLLIVLVIMHAHFQKLPIAPQNLWDVAKDVRNWCWSVLAVIFALELVLRLVGLVGSFLESRWPQKRRLATVSCGALTLLLVAGHLFVLLRNSPGYLRWPQGAYFTASGGNRDVEIAYFGQAVVDQIDLKRRAHALKDAPVLVADKDSSEPMRSFQLYGCGAQWTLGDLHDLDSRVLKADSGFIVADQGRISDWFGKDPPSLNLQELESIYPGKSLYWFDRTTAHSGTLTSKMSPPFEIEAPLFSRNFSPKPRVNWDAFSPVPIRTKNGHTFLWGNEKGTIWAELPLGQHWDPSVVIKARFQADEHASLHVQSPAFQDELTLSADHAQAELKLKPDMNASAQTFYGSRWIPIAFEYHGELAKNPKFGYLQSYSLVKLEVFGKLYLW